MMMILMQRYAVITNCGVNRISLCPNEKVNIAVTCMWDYQLISRA